MTLDQCRRGLGTALSFALFGIGGLLIGLLIAPVLKLTIRDASRRRTHARVLIQYAFRAFGGLMRTLGVLDYRFEGLSRLQRPGLLILANHPSLIDVVFLLGHVPQADCIVKGKLASNPFTRGPIRAAGYITNRDPEAVLEAARQSLAAGNSLILFPEGTRTRPDRPVKFRRGGANIALRTGANITPVLIRCQPTTLTKGTPWYRIPPRKVQLDLHVLDDLSVPRETQQPTSLRARHLTRQLSDHFNHELDRIQHA
ncbi:lysophospholipid acyltransferase family protein [Vreelandella subglaciescola]|jgi:1-acyl-sn-glycerol-3-phosphate acyltransferase|uniref:1-acyl-sn-glycerol-3-phosphate acyltransferases n=1 Tax=Vreelandella subglaciescola TaxID=29571 RepID=A0A1M7I7K1_9GAMM|nr:lysophospholipid acyltransferase family protein [Halomonas subglaciescola]SHM36771.1 1-acyl-sn-glycerol-3-phosphate acyltransferases [Halomonas subglaciescola]